jgi:uncharacterized protein (TIGR00290 family)
MNCTDPNCDWRTVDQARYFCSWSGGKDSCLALHRAMARWGAPEALVNILTEGGTHSRSHGLPVRALEAQAAAIGVPIVQRNATWADYEAQFVDALKQLRAQGVEAGVFGDIDLQVHWDWEKGVCAQAGMTAFEPLWQDAHQALVAEFLAAGFEATIVTVNLERVPEEFLGRSFSTDTVAELMSLGVDVSGEGGEFHTVVLDGPIFSSPIAVEKVGIRRHEGYATLELR